jgi:hypothetical protein
VGISKVERFFGSSYRKPFGIDVYTSRAGLDEMFKKRWNAPPTEKWMVAAGIAEGLFILSPIVWKTEAEGHKGDAEDVRRIVTHELVHVYHAQHSPQPEFDGMEKFAWFIEGLATYAAGQLEGRGLTAKQAIQEGKEPKTLAEAWSGNYRYGVSGSIVRYVDETYGRKKVIALLAVTDTRSALKLLGTSESSFLSKWKASELARR